MDTRKWKCLFGMHQWKIIGETKREYFYGQDKRRPYQITTLYRQRCAHCGKILHEEY
jgi:hypothetical protein